MSSRRNFIQLTSLGLAAVATQALTYEAQQ
jgi:hypothetical protein